MTAINLLQPALGSDFASVVLRLIAAAVFINHGSPKLFGATRAQLKEGVKQFMGVPGVMFDAMAGLELFGGILLIFGFLTLPISALFSLQFIGITLFDLAKARRPPLNRKFAGGWELDPIMLAVVLALLLVGPGQFSVDSFVGI